MYADTQTRLLDSFEEAEALIGAAGSGGEGRGGAGGSWVNALAVNASFGTNVVLTVIKAVVLAQTGAPPPLDGAGARC